MNESSEKLLKYGMRILTKQVEIRMFKAYPTAKAMTFTLAAITGCPFSNVEASTIEAVNHTHWAINRFSVDGRSGVDTIGAYQGGGGGCCYFVPGQWRSGMSVRIDWETGAWSWQGFPGYADRAKYLAWRTKIRAQTRQHTKQVPIPDYTGQKVCGITVHFLPCDDVQVTTSCYAYGAPEYPIKIPLELPVPQSCPQPDRSKG